MTPELIFGYIFVTMMIGGLIATVYLIGRGIYLSILFRRDRNPYRRFCRKCGQQQDWYQYSWAVRAVDGWWEDMQSIPDPDCVCHKYAENRG